MNIKISHNWLLEYIETNASPYDIQKYLSLCGPSVDSVEKKENDYVYDIEITSNRIDTASVLGIAQECLAILPMFGKKAILKEDPLKKYSFQLLQLSSNPKFSLTTSVNPSLCSRFCAIVLDNIKIGKSPEFISKRLTACGIKSINNVIDISNYLMLSLGQPTHVFDFDKIEKGVMIMRESKKGEKIVTLDEKKITLPGGDIVIEDGRGNLIDMCGIMGGFNSAINEKTKRVLLFVQTYDKYKIRKTSLATGQRTVAATFFEKGLDEERVEPTLVYGVELLEKYTQAKIASVLYDLYPNPKKEKIIKVDLSQVKKQIGIDISNTQIISILKNLGFKISGYSIHIPTYRTHDIEIIEDIVEEVARIYGYNNLPNNLPPVVYVEQPQEIEDMFEYQKKIKIFLKHLGLNEVMNYSMISKEMIERFGLETSSHLRLENSISEDIEYMRISLLPSLIKNIQDNQGKREELKYFEIAKVYLPKKDELPDEKYKLAIAVNTDFSDLKGISEALNSELNIDHDIREKIIQKGKIYLVEIDFLELIKQAKLLPQYKPINPYAVIKLDLTLRNTKTKFQEIKKIAFSSSKLLQKIEVIGTYENNLTLRFYFSSVNRNITEEEAKAELSSIKILI